MTDYSKSGGHGRAGPRNAPPRHVVDVVEVDPLLGAGVVGAVGEVAAGGEADALGEVGGERAVVLLRGDGGGVLYLLTMVL